MQVYIIVLSVLNTTEISTLTQGELNYVILEYQ
jgi:hypothetical protein